MPRCVICMYWLGMPDPHSRGSVAADAEAVVAKEDNMSKFITVCRGCWHMSHSAHAQEWFYGRNGIDGLETAAGHDVCPVPDCQCRCKDVDVGVFEQTRRALAEEEMLPAKALAEANENTPME